MTDNTFFTDNMNFSFSNISTFTTCPYAWKLTYIDSKERYSNYYSEFGNLCHDVMEKFMGDELDIFDLSDYFTKNYSTIVRSSPPPFPKGLSERYYNEMIEFLDNVTFDKSINQPLSIEEFISMIIGDVSVIAKPDLLYKDTVRDKIILCDFKTSKPFAQSGKLDKKKIDGYTKQLLLYAYIIKEISDIHIDEIFLWFLRYDERVFIPFTQEDVKKTLDEFIENVNIIKDSTEYLPNIKNKFFCQSLCSVGWACKYRPVYEPKTEWAPD